MTYLSPMLNRLAEVIGLPLALHLCHAFGGTEIYVPLRPRADHPVAVVIGVDATAHLAREIGNRIDVPKADDVTRAGRNKAIVDAATEGVPKSALALQHGLTTRWVRRICNGEGGDDRQPGLFDLPGE